LAFQGEPFGKSSVLSVGQAGQLVGAVERVVPGVLGTSRQPYRGGNAVTPLRVWTGNAENRANRAIWVVRFQHDSWSSAVGVEMLCI